MDGSRQMGKAFSSIQRSSSYHLSRLPALVLGILLVLLLAVSLFAQQASEGSAISGDLFPAIEVTPAEAVSPGVLVVFDASASSHSIFEGRVGEVRYIWDLGDGTMQIGERIAHPYSMSGMFSIELTMEIFETDGVFHRATETAQVLVTATAMPTSVPVIDLQSLLELAPGITAILIQAEDPVLLVTQEDDSSRPPAGASPCLFCPALDLEHLVLSGGLLTVGELRLVDAMVAMELATDGWLGFVSFGTNFSPATFSLTDQYPLIENAGYEIAAVIDRAYSASLGLCYEFEPTLYLLGAVGLLHTEGIYQGSPRLTVGNDPLPGSFSERRVTLSFGMGLRIGWGMLTLRALLIL